MPNVLILNGGSSSIRFAMYEVSAPLKLLLQGKMDHVGLPSMTLSHDDAPPVAISAPSSPPAFLVDWLCDHGAFDHLTAVGHRIVHGMQHTEPALATEGLVSELRAITASDPEHLPLELELIEAIRARYPAIPQVVCFDTSFHRHLPRVAKVLPIPRRFEAKGVHRYGFHGLSYAYLLEELQRLDDNAVKQKRVILAHLGGGASLAAVFDGQCIDTSMGFTPAGGVMMSTRSGDVDPGLMGYLSRTERLSAAELQRMLTHESGLLGVSETSADMRQLLASKNRDERAAEAIALFCYQIKKCIGAYTAALGGLDTVVFAGGIGENCALIRSLICQGLAFLGVEVDESLNTTHHSLISTEGARVKVRVIPTNEELMVARTVCSLLGLQPS